MFRRVACISSLTLTIVSGLACGGAAQDGPSSEIPTDTPSTLTSACGAREDVFVSGVSKAEGNLIVRIAAADPAPPRRGINVWRLQVTDGSGAPVSGASVRVTPFMPDHGHGTSVTPMVTPQQDGNYQVNDIYLYMAGLWETTIAVTPDGETTPTQVVFRFCIEG